MSNPYQQQIQRMVWSFSRLNSYDTCPYGWKLHYLDHTEQVGSGFADWGSLCHSVFEDYEKGALADFELLDAYEARYPEYMHNDFPPCRGTPLADRYYERGRELFASFSGFPENWEILGVELKVEFEVNDRKFVGFIDLLVRDQHDGKLIVVDHKSKSEFKTEEEKAHYALQLYLYAYWVFLHYEEYPKELIFDMFRVGYMVHIPFEKSDMDLALTWFQDTVDRILCDEDFWDKIAIAYDASNKPLADFQRNDFFCNYLCGSRTSCDRSLYKIGEEFTA